ncbi:MAG: ATP phosphoribosyltransferase regulatory subunit [Aquificaceae bacterium]|nr:ATP phosphoribosyltransferase regulatory subunit [Aquificaceae bacterium]MDW8423669.1 ATP phosphoribosyltransferase regulatory subunit [Aquificaceae bacterium]
MKVIPPQERFFNFEDSERLKGLFLKACEVFKDYRFIVLPSLEVYDREFYGENPFVVGSLQDDSLLCLRRDWTVSIARFLSLQRNMSLPLRVFYWGNVFSPGGNLESYQVGVELLGDPSVEAEVEVLKSIAEYLRACGFQDLTLSLGHVAIVEELLLRYGHEYRQAILQKNFSTLSSVEPLKDLLLAYGGFDVLQSFERKYPEFSAYCQRLREVAERLEGIRVLFDLSEIRPKDYYTGLVFEFFHPKVGQPIAGGGRYDGLYKSLGKDLCAFGGAVYLDLLLEV